MVAAPPLVATYKSNVALTVAPTVANTTFKAGDWIYILALTDDSYHQLGTPTGPPVGSPGWTVLLKVETADTVAAYAWYAKVTADWTGTISMPIKQNGTTQSRFVAYRYDARSAGLGATKSLDIAVAQAAAQGAMSFTLTTQKANSTILWAGGDWLDQAWSGTPAYRVPSGSTPAVDDGHGHTDRANWLVAHHVDAGPAGAKVLGLTTPTTWQNTAVAVEVLGDTVLPSGVPNINAVLATETSVTVTWDAATDNAGIASYTVYRDGVSIATVPVANARTYTDTGLTPETTYQYTVRATDTSGNLGAVLTSKSITMPAQRLKLQASSVNMMLGATQVSEVYLGATRIWAK